MKGLSRVLGVEREITSPTFVVEAIYKCKTQNAKRKIKIIYHLDVYRVKQAVEILALGWEEILADPTAAVVVEWAERIAEVLPPQCIWVRFKFIDTNTREIKITDERGD
jgi:tRNA threonylcarbamoyladenosine biosynthesis protein TsaE